MVCRLGGPCFSVLMVTHLDESGLPGHPYLLGSGNRRATCTRSEALGRDHLRKVPFARSQNLRSVPALGENQKSDITWTGLTMHRVGTTAPKNPFGETISDGADRAGPVDDLPDLPHDFSWSPQRALITKSEGGRGNAVDILVSAYPIYLDSVQTGEVRGEWTFVLRQFIPERGWFDLPISASVLFGSQLPASLRSSGVQTSTSIPTSFDNVRARR